MTTIKLDDIPDLVKSNKLSKQEACVQVYYTLYTNPARFGLLDMDEDYRSDFLLHFLQHKTNNLIQNYNPDISPFGAYVYKTIQTARLTFKKNFTDKQNYNTLFIQDSIYAYQEQLEESATSVTKIASPTEEFSQVQSEEKIPSLVYKQLFTKQPHRLCKAQSQERRLKRGILILALKSAWYISDEQINKVSKVCNISPDVITQSVCHLKSLLINKALNRQLIEENRNRAYSFIHNYRMQLQNPDRDKDQLKLTQINKKLQFQMENWNKKTQKLQSGKYKISPTNSEIGKIIGLPERLVSFYMRKIKEMDSETISSII